MALTTLADIFPAPFQSYLLDWKPKGVRGDTVSYLIPRARYHDDSCTEGCGNEVRARSANWFSKEFKFNLTDIVLEDCLEKVVPMDTKESNNVEEVSQDPLSRGVLKVEIQLKGASLKGVTNPKKANPWRSGGNPQIPRGQKF